MISDAYIESGSYTPRHAFHGSRTSILVVSWNIDRGAKLQGVVDFLAEAKADLVLLQEADVNAKRTGNRHVAQEVSRSLGLNYVFAPEFQELAQGRGPSLAYHGQATLSPWPLSNSRTLRFQKQSRFWQPRWFLPKIAFFQRRIGGRIALVGEVNIGGHKLVTYNVHLESRGSDQLRCSQLEECLADVSRYGPRVPIILAGDFNMNVLHSDALYAVERTRFCCMPAEARATTRPRRFKNRIAEPIDWILARGPVHTANLRVHSSVSASDHYPISLDLIVAKEQAEQSCHSGLLDNSPTTSPAGE